MLRYHSEHGLPVAIVQPTIVYGPFSRPWTVNIVDQLRDGLVALPANIGFCNAVYIDDVVNGMILAALKDDAAGESFLISADEPVTWTEFFGEYERILGIQPVVLLPPHEVEHIPLGTGSSWRSSPLWRQWRRVLSNSDVRVALVHTPVVNWPYRLARRFAPGRWTVLRARYFDQPGSCPAPITGAGSNRSPQARSIQQPDPSRLALYLAKTRARIDKARRVLDYQPAFDFERGMILTEQFVRWYFSL
jgi:nucleoside-diphosphate-sugar epimerase